MDKNKKLGRLKKIDPRGSVEARQMSKKCPSRCCLKSKCQKKESGTLPWTLATYAPSRPVLPDPPGLVALLSGRVSQVTLENIEAGKIILFEPLCTTHSFECHSLGNNKSSVGQPIFFLVGQPNGFWPTWRNFVGQQKMLLVSKNDDDDKTSTDVFTAKENRGANPGGAHEAVPRSRRRQENGKIPRRERTLATQDVQSAKTESG